MSVGRVPLRRRPETWLAVALAACGVMCTGVALMRPGVLFAAASVFIVAMLAFTVFTDSEAYDDPDDPDEEDEEDEGGEGW